jgi:hypothetical protein
LADKRGTREYDEWFLKYNPNSTRKEPQTTMSAQLNTPESAFIETPNAKAEHKTRTTQRKKPRNQKKSSSTKTLKNKLFKYKKGFGF